MGRLPTLVNTVGDLPRDVIDLLGAGAVGLDAINDSGLTAIKKADPCYLL